MVIRAARQVSVQNPQRRVASSQKTKDLFRTLAFYPITPLKYDPSPVVIIILIMTYTLIHFLLLAVFIFTKYAEYPKLSHLYLLISYFYCFLAGFCYQQFYKKEKYLFYTYLYTLSVIYSPFLLFLYNLLYPFFQGFGSLICLIVMDLISCYFIRINITDTEIYDQRTAFADYMVVFIVQFLGVIINVFAISKIQLFTSSQ